MFAALPSGPLGDNFAPAVYDTVAIRSGDFNDPSIWTNGVPTNGENFNIEEDIEVNIGRRIPGRFNFVNIEGTLSFDSDANTRLRVETVRVENGGRLEVGTAANPIDEDRTAQIVFTRYRAEGDDRDGFSLNDPTRLGLGLLVQPGGQLETAGQSRSAQVASAENNRASRRSFARNSDTILVTGNASNFRVGDEITIAATRFRPDDGNQTETVRIRSISELPNRIEGRRAFEIGLGNPDDHTEAYRLRFDHRNIRGNATNVVNLTRNVVFQTSNAGVNSQLFQGRGHIFLQSQDVRIQGTELRDLGRTDNTRLSEDGEDGVRIRAENGELTDVVVPETRDGFINQRGRNALKFSRTLDVKDDDGNYINDASNLALVTGSVVNGAPGWGFINHSSGVNFINNVAVDVVGAAFIASAGNEIGTFRGNVALEGDGDGSFFARPVELAGPRLSPEVQAQFRDFTRERFGRAEDIQTQEVIVRHGDHARTGEGFWIQSPGVEVIDNVAAGFDGRGFAIYNQGLFETDRNEEAGFRIDLIDWGDETYRIWDDPGSVRDGRAVVQNLALNRFEGNTAYANFLGLQVRFSSHNNRTFTVDKDGQFEFSDATDRRGRTNLEGLTVSDFTSLRNEIGFSTSYVTNAIFEDFVILNDGPDSFGYGVLAQQQLSGQIQFNNFTIEGYSAAIDFQNSPVDFVLSDPDFDVVNENRAIRLRTNATGNVARFALSDLDEIRSNVFADI